MAGSPRFQHIPALDGLRGLALLGVLLFHANGALRGGYLGVDLFFVLSGYLITTLLVAEHRASGRIDLRSFWVRRARRLLPAVLALMPAIALYARVLARPDDLSTIRADALATLGYVANWRAILANRSYWSLFAAPSPLEHTWSLAIEEQFYVVWPLVVVAALGRRTPRAPRALGALTLGLLLLSVARMLALFDPASTSRVYLGTDTRAAGILAGALLATVLTPGQSISDRAARALDALGVLGALGLALAWTLLEGSSAFLYRGGLWLTELGALVLIACAVVVPRGLVARALAWRPLTLVGTISYGLYLWHWPIDVVLTADRTHVRGPALQALRLALTFAVAVASYRLLERPLRQRGLPFGRPVVMVPLAFALPVALVLLATRPRAATAAQMAGMTPPASASAPPVLDVPGVAPWRLLVLGDSTANSLGWVIRGTQEPGLSVELRGQDGCTILTDRCAGPDWPQYARELHPEATIVFLGGAFLHGLTADGAWRKSCHRVWDHTFESTLSRRLTDLAATGVRVWLVTIPYPLGPYEDDPAFRKETDCINTSLRRVAQATPGVSVLEFGPQLCPGKRAEDCVHDSGGHAIRPDGVHYTMDGGAAVARWLVAQVRPAASAGKDPSHPPPAPQGEGSEGR